MRAAVDDCGGAPSRRAGIHRAAAAGGRDLRRSPDFRPQPGAPSGRGLGRQGDGGEARVPLLLRALQFAVRPQSRGPGPNTPEVMARRDPRTGAAPGNGQPAIPKLKVWQCDASCEMEFGQTFILPSQIEQRIEARREEGGRVVETSIDVARWVVVHVEDAANAKVAERVISAESATPGATPYTSAVWTR